jgi:hypothetical protein
MGQNAETDRVVEESIVTLKKLGAVIVDSVSLRDYILKAQTEISNVLHHSQFKASIGEYLKRIRNRDTPNRSTIWLRSPAIPRRTTAVREKR